MTCLKRFPLSEKRLPYHQLMSNSWKILSPEISEQSLSRLIPLAHILDINPDKFYITIVQNHVSHLASPKKDLKYSECAITSKFSFFKPMLSKLKDNEVAVQTTVYIAGHFPCGSERVAAYRLALLFAEKWQQSCISTSNSEKV